MLVLLWLSRIVAGIAALLALILALSHAWSGAAQSVFLAVLLYVVGERFATGRRRSRPDTSAAREESANTEER